MKREYSDSEGDDAFSDHVPDKNYEPNQESSCHVASRKKRRGIIEKRRRDRINNSLSELRRLVPAAFEKQGSAKLEKAEILQLTVDHLKMIQAKGLDAFAYDPHKLAMDYHSLGFRECAAEVARYFVTVEGMDIQDPLRLRLMSHLQCFSAQRDFTAKQAAAWSFPSSFTNAYGSPLQQSANISHNGFVPPHILSNQSFGGLESISHSIPTHAVLNDASLCSSNLSVNRIGGTTLPLNTIPQTISQSSSQYVSCNNITAIGTATNSQYSANYSSPNASNSQVKPYRPWGGPELAY